MTDFTFPKPGELVNAASIPVAERTLAALLSLALVGRNSLVMREGDDFNTPQMLDAISEVTRLLSDRFYQAACDNAKQVEADRDAEYPF